jgi:uncharacterized RDD family membrane protein YckC
MNDTSTNVPVPPSAPQVPPPPSPNLQVPVPPMAGPQVPLHPTVSTKRFFNLVIDSIAYYVIAAVIAGILGAFWPAFDRYSSTEGYTWYVLIIALLYYITMESLTGKTLGKYATKTRVVMKDGSQPDLPHIVGRTFGRYIPFDAISYLFPGGRGWHDKVSGTAVVDDTK